MAWRPKAAGPKSIRSLYHWIWAQLSEIGIVGGGDLPTDPPTPGQPLPPQPLGSHNHYLENLLDTDIASKVHRSSLSYQEATGLWEADSRSKTFIQTTIPADSESSTGDLWVVTAPP
jgi:hypothetical protein